MRIPSIDLDSGRARMLEIIQMVGDRNRHMEQFMGDFVQHLYGPASEEYEVDDRRIFGKDLGHDMAMYYLQGVRSTMAAWDQSIRAGFICC